MTTVTSRGSNLHKKLVSLSGAVFTFFDILSQATCLYDSFCHVTRAHMQREKMVPPTPVMHALLADLKQISAMGGSLLKTASFAD